MADKISILMVADGALNFDDEDSGFGITRLPKVLKAYSGGRIFDVKTEIRRRDFFTIERLRGVDQLWLFGHGAHSQHPREQPITDNELAAIVTFMNQGGGVFATGDHEDLGVQMCGRIPRVRSMRKWYFPNSGPNGEPAAPRGTDDGKPGLESRHDTIRAAAGGKFYIEDQEDHIPQPIEILAPHPLLDDRRGGTIGIFPDHAHEGECIEPWTLTWKYQYGVVRGDEYPESSPGVRPSPKLLANVMVIDGHETHYRRETRPPKPKVKGKKFGLLTAYDGRGAGVGRVIADSTWHHFIDINLKGFDDVKPTLQLIYRYFCNIAEWLTPIGKQRDLVAVALRAALQTYPLGEAFPLAEPSDAETAAIVGGLARASLDSLGLTQAVTEALAEEAGFAAETADVALGGAILQLVSPSRGDDDAAAAIEGARAALSALMVTS